jgi:hypothetical protein
VLTLRTNLRRRVSITHKHGSVVVRIERHNDRTLYILLLLAFTAGFVSFCSILVPPLIRNFSFRNFLIVLPFLAFILIWYLIGLRVGVWRAFGVEQVVIEGDILRWTRTALWWKRDVEIPTSEVTEVRAVTPWHALSNRVEFTAHGRRRKVGDMLLRDETAELAHELRHAVGLRR